jgi:hypothetical protein
LGADKVRYVGGAVRDTLLGLVVKDIDLATVLVPEEVVALLKTAGIRTVPTGIEHGTVTALLTEGPVEITTLRHDVSTDGRRATVAFAQEWQEDAARRRHNGPSRRPMLQSAGRGPRDVSMQLLGGYQPCHFSLRDRLTSSAAVTPQI